MNINSITISGNLTRDPALQFTQAGTGILNFGIAVNKRRRDPQSGEWVDAADFFDVTLFGTRAKPLSEILSKGTKVCIHGALRSSTWLKDDERRTKVDIVAHEIDIVSKQAYETVESVTVSVPVDQLSGETVTQLGLDIPSQDFAQL